MNVRMNAGNNRVAGTTSNGDVIHYRNPDLDFSQWDDISGARRRCCCCWWPEEEEEGTQDRDFCHRVRRCLLARNWENLSEQDRNFCRRVRRCLCGEAFESGSEEWRFCRRVRRCLCRGFWENNVE